MNGADRTHIRLPTEKKPEPEVQEDETTEFIIEVETAEDKAESEKVTSETQKTYTGKILLK